MSLALLKGWWDYLGKLFEILKLPKEYSKSTADHRPRTLQFAEEISGAIDAVRFASPHMGCNLQRI